MHVDLVAAAGYPAPFPRIERRPDTERACQRIAQRRSLGDGAAEDSQMPQIERRADLHAERVDALAAGGHLHEIAEGHERHQGLRASRHDHPWRQPHALQQALDRRAPVRSRSTKARNGATRTNGMAGLERRPDVMGE